MIFYFLYVNFLDNTPAFGLQYKVMTHLSFFEDIFARFIFPQVFLPVRTVSAEGTGLLCPQPGFPTKGAQAVRMAPACRMI